MVGKWLNAEAKFFIFDEPTRGIDVGAKAEIFALLDRLVQDGAAILMISSEQTEIVHVCDRAYVMRDGRIVGELARNELTEANIVQAGDAPVIAAARAGTAATWLARVPGVAIVLVAAVRRVCPGERSNLRQPANVANILVQSTILLLLALPMTLIIMTEGLDLSMGAVLTLRARSSSRAVDRGDRIGHRSVSPPPLAVGLGFGLANGALIAFLDIPPFIATLGTLGIAQGLSLVVTDGQSVVGLPRSIQVVYSGDMLGVPVPIVDRRRCLSRCSISCSTTRAFGTYIFALGGNREALRLAGVSDRADADRRLCARRR